MQPGLGALQPVTQRNPEIMDDTEITMKMLTLLHLVSGKEILS